MKKPAIIIAIVAGVLVLAIIGAIVADTMGHKTDSTSQPVVMDPLAPPQQPAQIANLQAPLPQRAGDADVARLITQLGDADWNKRHEATEALKKIGKSAVPQLEQAANSPNSETSTRAKAILREVNGGDAEVAANNAGGNQPNALQGMMGGGGQGGAGGMDLGALMNNPQVQQMMQNPQMMDMARQMMAGQGGQGGQGGGGQLNGANLGALMQNPQVQQMMQNPQMMQMVMKMMAGQGGRGGLGGGAQGGRAGRGGGQLGGGNLGALMQNPQIQQMIQQMMAGGGGRLGGGGALARNAPPPPPAADLSTDLTATFGARVGEANGGVRVVDVKANSIASNAGVKVGDLIVSVNGRQMTSGDDLKDALAAAGGQKINLEVQRGGEVITLSAKN